MKGKSMAAILLVTALGLTACGGQGTGAAASQEAAQEAQTGEAGGEQSEEADGDELTGTDALRHQNRRRERSLIRALAWKAAVSLKLPSRQSRFRTRSAFGL